MRQDDVDTVMLPAKVRDAFADRTWLNTGELCQALEMSPTVLRKHIKAGNIEWHQKGFGARKIQRHFTFSNVARFWQQHLTTKGNT